MGAGGSIFVVGGVSGFRDTDQLDTIERGYTIVYIVAIFLAGTSQPGTGGS